MVRPLHESGGGGWCDGARGHVQMRAHGRDDRPTLATTLRRLRGQRGWTQQQLADRAGISKEAVSCYEAGRKRPHRSTAMRIAATLDVPAAHLGATPSPKGSRRTGSGSVRSLS
jgi:putative transcriptional regulator